MLYYLRIEHFWAPECRKKRSPLCFLILNLISAIFALRLAIMTLSCVVVFSSLGLLTGCFELVIARKTRWKIKGTIDCVTILWMTLKRNRKNAEHLNTLVRKKKLIECWGTLCKQLRFNSDYGCSACPHQRE